MQRSVSVARCFVRHCCHTSQNGKNSPSILKFLDGKVDTNSQQFKDNCITSKEHTDRFKQFLTLARAGGGPKGIERHTVQNKKLFVRDRLRLLLDDDSDFLELSSLAGMGMDYGNIPSASVINGIGKIHGRWCLVTANDASIKGGTIFPVSVKKNLRSQKIAEENQLPCVYVVDSGGAFLPLQSEIFPDRDHGGQAFYNEAIMSSQGIPQVAVVVGSCTAGGAYIPTMATEAVIVHKIGTIFLGGPPLVYAALGEVVSQEDLGGGIMHSSISGCTDYYETTEEEAFHTTRDIVACLNIPQPAVNEGYEEPAFSLDDIPGIIPKHNQNELDAYKVISRIVDGSRFHEFKKLFGPTLVTGFAFIHGQLIGIIANNQGPISEQAALKATHFIQLCVQRRCPIVFLQNTSPLVHGFSTKEQGIEASKLLKAQGKMIAAVACADVPKITIIVGNSFGAENYAMAGRSMSPRFLFLWPNAKIAMMEEQAWIEHTAQASLVHGGSNHEEKVVQLKSKLRDRIAQESTSFYSSGRVWDDGIILPQDTRKVLGQCLSIVTLNMDKTSIFTQVKDPVLKM